MLNFLAGTDIELISLPLPIVHGGGDGGAGLVGVLEALLDNLTRAVESGGGNFNPIAGLQALGTNVHPMIVHFPIAFLTGFLILDVIGVWSRRLAIRQVASGMLYLGAIGAVCAVIAGLIAEASVPHGEGVHEIMQWHERLGITVATLSVGLAIWRLVAGANLSRMAQTFHFLSATLIVVLVFLGADLGGLMVYEHGVGVHNLQGAEASLEHRSEHGESDHHHHDQNEVEISGE